MIPDSRVARFEVWYEQYVHAHVAKGTKAESKLSVSALFVQTSPADRY